MKILLVIGSIVVPFLMFYSQYFSTKFIRLYDILALASILIFGNIASLSIYRVIVEKTIFMTTIHGIFLNPYFLITGAYIGLYVLYRLLLLGFEKR